MDRIIYVYLSRIPENGIIKEVFPPLRAEEIASTGNERVKREKYYVWKLLEYALHDALNLNIRDIIVKKEASGKWTADSFHFSLSHCNGVVAVALSNDPVGIDIELSSCKVRSHLAEKIFTKNEKSRYLSLPEDERDSFLLQCWTAKESIFKMRGEKVFSPHTIDTLSTAHITRYLSVGSCDVILSVAPAGSANIKIVPDLNSIQ